MDSHNENTKTEFATVSRKRTRSEQGRTVALSISLYPRRRTKVRPTALDDGHGKLLNGITAELFEDVLWQLKTTNDVRPRET
jgi:hypothetical protein